MEKLNACITSVVDNIDSIKIACDALSDEIRRECNSDKINTARVRMLTEELTRLEGIGATSIDDISNNLNQHNQFPMGNRPIPAFNEVPARNSVFDSLSDVANSLFKKGEIETSMNMVDNMIRWLHFLDEVEPKLIDRSIISSKGELDDIRDSILTAIIKNMRRKAKDVLAFGENIYTDNTDDIKGV